MKIDRKTNSEIRANKEKLVMENFASIMKKLDATFLIESDEEKKEYESPTGEKWTKKQWEDWKKSEDERNPRIPSDDEMEELH